MSCIHADFRMEWQLPMSQGRHLSPPAKKKGPLMNAELLKRLALSLTVSAAMLGASELANAQGRRGRGEERSQENQAARDQRQQQRQQEQQNRQQDRQAV